MIPWRPDSISSPKGITIVDEDQSKEDQEDDTKKQLNTHKMIYMILTIIMVIFLILSVNIKLK